MEKTIGLLKCEFKLCGSIFRVKSISRNVLFVNSCIPVHNKLIYYNKRNNSNNDAIDDVMIYDEFASDYVEMNSLPQHSAIRTALNITALNRRERMGIEKI